MTWHKFEDKTPQDGVAIVAVYMGRDGAGCYRVKGGTLVIPDIGIALTMDEARVEFCLWSELPEGFVLWGEL